jgi:hypothetical protein
MDMDMDTDDKQTEQIQPSGTLNWHWDLQWHWKTAQHDAAQHRVAQQETDRAS